jgi:hypothetical protein
VSTGAGEVEAEAEVDLDDGTPHQLVFVREESHYRLYVDATEAATLESPADLDWDVDHELFLGNDATLSRPLTGNIHLLALYAEALTDAHIKHLFDLGLMDPPEPSSPLVFICPDPEVIGRGVLDLLAEAIPFAAPGGAGAGGVESLCSDRDLRETSWTWHPRNAQDAAREDIQLETLESPGPCQRRVSLHYDPDLPPLQLDIGIEIAQVPVRGRTLAGEAAFTLSLPMRRLFRRGDASGDGAVDISDAIFLLGALFLGDKKPRCRDAADSDDSGTIEITDAILLLNYLFLGELPPPPPGPTDCGEDPASGDSRGDGLDCAEYPDPEKLARSCPAE